MAKNGKYTLISADSHVIEPRDLFEKRLPAELQSRAPKLQDWKGGSAWMVDGFDPVPLPVTAGTGSGYRPGKATNDKPLSYDDVLPALYDPVERIKAQEADSVDAEVLYPSSALWDTIKMLDDADLKLACVKAYNDWITEFCAHNPDRLIGMAKIPTTSVDDARAELLRCANELKLRGAVLDAWPSGAQVGGNPDDDPFWEAANEAGLPISLHIGIGADIQTSPQGGIEPGMKPQIADVIQPMVTGGVFDRFPNLKIVFAHADAGWAMHWLEYMDMYYLRHRHLSGHTLQDPNALPSDYLRKHLWFTFHHDQVAVKNIRNLGPAHLIWASHFPYDDSNWPDNRQQAVQVTSVATSDAQRALMAENVAKLYELPGYENGFDPQAIEDFVELVHY